MINNDRGEGNLSHCSEVGRPEDGTPVPSPLIVEGKQLSNLHAIQSEENRKSQMVGKCLTLAHNYILLCQKCFIICPSERNKSTTV